jgi:non-heme chloroperoxidase
MRSKTAALLIASFLLTAGVRAEAKPAGKDGFLTLADGAKIRYVEAGQGSPIVFIPGWTAGAEIWAPQIAHLSNSHRVVAFDPRSQGRSSKTSEGSYPAARARDLQEILDQLKLAPATLVCWSLAVPECVAYIDLFGTGKIAGLVLVDGVTGEPDPPERAVAKLGFLAKLQKDRHAMTEQLVRSWFRTPRSKDFLRRVVDTCLETPTDTAIALVVGNAGQDNSKALGKIDKPTLVVITESPFTADYQKMREKIPGSRLEVVPAAGHALFVDQAERFNKLLEEFVGSLGNP